MRHAAIFLAVVGLAMAACTSVPEPLPSPTGTATAKPTVAPAGSAPEPTNAAPSPIVLPNDVAVGAKIDCSDPAMKRHCDTWTAAALAATGIPASSVMSSAIHVAWSTAMRTMEVDVAVELHKTDGSIEFVPLFCGPTTWEAICDTSDVTMPPH